MARVSDHTRTRVHRHACCAVYDPQEGSFSLLGAKFHIYNPAGDLIGFSKQKAFKLKEDIRVYRDEAMDEEWLHIGARNIIDFSAAYDVTEPKSGRRLGTLRRAGLSSMFRDKWIVLDADERQIGEIAEDSMLLAMVRPICGEHYPAGASRLKAAMAKNMPTLSSTLIRSCKN